MHNIDITYMYIYYNVCKLLKIHQLNTTKIKKSKIYKKRHVKDIKSYSKEGNKKWQYGRERYKNFTEDEKQRLVEYRKKIL